VTWQAVKQSGCRPSPRSSASLVMTGPNVAMLFGGVFDEVMIQQVSLQSDYWFTVLNSPLELYLTASELWCGQEQEGILS